MPVSWSRCCRSSFRWALVCLLVLVSVASLADDDWTQTGRNQLAQIKAGLKAGDAETLSQERLAAWGQSLAEIRARAQDCADDLDKDLQRQRQNLESLGEPLPVTSTDVATKAVRSKLEQQVAVLEKRLATCRALLIDSEALAERVQRLKQEVLTGYLLVPGPPIWDVVLSNLANPEAWYQTGKEIVANSGQIARLNRQQWLLVITALILGALLGTWLKTILRQGASSIEGDELTGRFLASCRSCLARPLPLLFALIAVALSLSLLLPVRPLPPLLALIISLTAYVLARSLLNILLRPAPPASYFLSLDEGLARSLHRRLQMLLLLGLAGVMGTITGLETAMAPMQWFALRSGFLLLVAVNLIWVFSSLGRLPGLVWQRWLRVLLVIALLLAVVAEIAGYHNLARFVLGGLLATVMLGLLFRLLYAFFIELLDGLDDGKHDWQRRLRRLLGLSTGQSIPGLIWLRVLIVVAIWISYIMSLVSVWGFSGSGWPWLWNLIVNGFEIGSIRLVPLQLLLALFVLMVSLALVGWLKRESLPQLLGRSRLDRGAREAVLTISGYIGSIVSVLLALSLAGFDFTSLAIVAGALSVGIGFGLQNIVNNFVSGIILLFERPIRTDDWVIVGGTEGFVRRISIRSTLIETFDRADVIVPNSELISNQVANMTLRDAWGRLVLPIGVAYGTDVEAVRDLLLKIADECPRVLKGHPRVGSPKVLFRGFGDSALDFELRCFVSDVGQRLDVISDLNFAIDKAFREAGIEIPFPQRDLHLRSVPAGGAGYPGTSDGAAMSDTGKTGDDGL